VEILQEGNFSRMRRGRATRQGLGPQHPHGDRDAPRFELCPGLLEIRFYAEQGIPAFAYGPGLLSVAHGRTNT